MASNKANDMIDDLIITLNKLFENDDSLGKVVKKPLLLLEGLNDLKKMIEMDNIKTTIIEQIKLLITNKARNDGKYENHMLHCVITGFPSSGKTTIARILAKIWISLDMIKQPTKKVEKTYTETLEKAVIEYDYKLNKLNKGIEHQIELMNKIRTGVNNLKNDGRKDYHKLLTNVRNARFNLDRMVDLPPIVEPEEELKFVVISRDQLIGAYLGQTAIKTRAILEKNLGGIVLIDEAYSLYNSDRDSFGEECLTVINEYMSLKSDQIIIIFSGYKDLMMNSIFKVQPGLKRRCMWFFDISPYSQEALSKIFQNQLLSQGGWLLDPQVDLNIIFKKYKDVLKNPGDTEKLVFECKITYSEHYFNQTLENKPHNSMITQQLLIKAINKKMLNDPVSKDDSVPAHMYC